MKILVVEDDEGIRTFVSKGLKEAGFIVDTASDGEEGFALLLTGQYDVAVVDIMLPGMDGLSVIEKYVIKGIRLLSLSSVLKEKWMIESWDFKREATITLPNLFFFRIACKDTGFNQTFFSCPCRNNTLLR